MKQASFELSHRHSQRAQWAASGQPTSPADDNEECAELDVGEIIHPEEDLTKEDGREPETDLGDWSLDLDDADPADDAEGPLTEEMYTQDELSIGLVEGGPGDDIWDEDEFLPVSMDQDLPELDDALDEQQVSVETAAQSRSLPQSQHPWIEQRLIHACPPFSGLATTEEHVVAAGENTGLFSLETLELVAQCPVSESTCSAAFLDAGGRHILLLTRSGCLGLWNRDTNAVDYILGELLSNPGVMIGRFNVGDRLTCWLLTAHGDLHLCYPNDRTSQAIHLPKPCVRVASTHSGCVALTSDHCLNWFAADRTYTRQQIREPSLCAGRLAINDSFIATGKNVVAVGTTDAGLWLSPDSGESFHFIDGTQQMTALAVGTYAGRQFAWVSRFLELDDRTELIAVDCRTRKAQVLAHFSILADSDGRHDDPPQRARVEQLHWDEDRQRLLAVGWFGLTCFAPSLTPSRISS